MYKCIYIKVAARQINKAPNMLTKIILFKEVIEKKKNHNNFSNVVIKIKMISKVKNEIIISEAKTCSNNMQVKEQKKFNCENPIKQEIF